MEKKTYKDLKDGDTVYVVNGAEGFEELTIKIREEYHPRMIENEEYDELCYFLELFNQLFNMSIITSIVRYYPVYSWIFKILN